MFYLLFLLLLTNSAQAQFLERKAEGWHFYEDKEKPQPTEDSISPPPEPLSKSKEEDPLQILEAYKKNLERLKAQAVLNPTFENVRTYMVAQKQMMGKAGVFAQKWLEVVYQTPQLDDTVRHPTSQLARHVYLDEKQAQMKQEVVKLSQTHGLFFFFHKSCPYCKGFAPIVKAFSQTYGWDVMAISMDGSSLPEFPEAVLDNGVAQRLGVTSLPALLAVNPQTEQIVPLSYGLLSQDQILDRIRVLILERNIR